MDIDEAIRTRHSVRQYLDRPIDQSAVNELSAAIEESNRESGMHLQLVLNEPKAMNCMLAKYGKFSGAVNYIAMVAPKKGFEEAVGYYGEKLVLLAKQLGLESCWVAGSYKKIPEAVEMGKDEKIHMIVTLGYGAAEGKPHKSKSAEAVSNVNEQSPEWFKRGVEFALAAPTAINQQKFMFELDGNKVRATAGVGPFSKTDLGIVKLHFEIGAGKENFVFE